MRFQNICFFLVVTTSLVSAAPAASVTREERAAVQHRVKRSPSLSLQQTDFKCSAPGIYADQQTGCQVFHFCQDGGRMDSFFCPNLTLFNQRFFVCDWSYNVDCDSAHLHFSLNDRLYESQSAETISNAINQPVGLAQDEILSRHQAPELNNYSSEPASLATSSSQLEAQIAVENTITIPASQEQTKYSSQDTTEDSQGRQRTMFPTLPTLPTLPTPPRSTMTTWLTLNLPQETSRMCQLHYPPTPAVCRRKVLSTTMLIPNLLVITVGTSLILSLKPMLMATATTMCLTPPTTTAVRAWTSRRPSQQTQSPPATISTALPTATLSIKHKVWSMILRRILSPHLIQSLLRTTVSQ